jgi:hypothetical protein
MRDKQQIAAWATAERKNQFAALAAGLGLSESKMLGLLIESVLASNSADTGSDVDGPQQGDRDRITIRLRPGDGPLLRSRAHARGMNYTTYAAALIRAHVRASAPMPVSELAKLEQNLAEVTAIARAMRQIAQATREGMDVDSSLRLELAAVLQAAEDLRQTLRELVRANVISWESGNA